MTHNHEIESMAQDAVAVIEAETVFEGIRFASGDMLTIALERPRKSFAVIRRVGEQIDVMSLHDDRASAVNRAKMIVDLIKEEKAMDAEGPKAGGPVQ
ncbi:hypothetical protein I6H96_21365 [Brucella anthropi]|uniref:Uncharacterized protein n=1 Tax=Brucella anthropi (strain ATCC 49188 / DSM 6882 / CCUG 24695 / JCM 21032 / LMG 3331 / NBRC 15819 / NCTC 12168 / Alc 37) TaxID=439375 RepID=A6X590_BRUA4|nr:hypothetical protein [Brucella anthropi]ABS16394.1 hypothetical protein Oant_3688 [Brucella anthropi ATCC 49188]NKC49088.1 hypothetical protein [Brucella anthropi ATCC 49188]QQC27281.1 hypothetical protein I6H96_21365 [Brucella anthropi]SUB43716.1 Uncharacterised protein [Brucella anthropi]